MTDDNLLATLLSIASSARPTLSAETIFASFPQNQLVEREFIDLQRKLDIDVGLEQYAPESGRFSAIDRRTYDGVGKHNVVGRGRTKQLAIRDLLEKLRDAE